MGSHDQGSPERSWLGRRGVLAVGLSIVVVIALALIGGMGHASRGVTSASAAEYQYSPVRIRFFAYVGAGGTTVPSGAPLYLSNGYTSGTKRLVVSALRDREYD